MELLAIAGGLALLLWYSRKGSTTDTPTDPIDDPTPDPPVDGPLPGASPLTAVKSIAVGPGFSGYVAISTGDTLSKIANLAGLSNWREIRDNPENAWAKEATPSSHWETYGLELVPRWGKAVGVDCSVAPGWMAALKSTYTGQFPILRVR